MLHRQQIINSCQAIAYTIWLQARNSHMIIKKEWPLPFEYHYANFHLYQSGISRLRYSTQSGWLLGSQPQKRSLIQTDFEILQYTLHKNSHRSLLIQPDWNRFSL